MKSSLRVLAFAESFLGSKSPNLDAHVFEEYVRLARKVELVVMAEELPLESTPDLKLIKIPKISQPMLFRTLIRVIGYAFAIIKNRKEFDVVYTRSLGLNFLIGSIIAKKLLKKKLIFFISESRKSHTSFRARFFRPFLKKVLEISDSVVTQSIFLVNEIDDYLIKINRNKLVILHEAVDKEKFKPENEPNENILLTVARIEPVKGIDVLINSMPYISKEFSDVKLKIVGSISNKNYFNELKNLISKLDCEKYIEFLGPIPHEQLPNLYNNAKIFIMTSKTEGSSISTLEAMSCGKPVVITRVGGMPTIIKDQQNGFLVEPNNPKMTAQRSIELLRDMGLREKIGRKARETIENDFIWETFIEGLITQFKKK